MRAPLTAGSVSSSGCFLASFFGGTAFSCLSLGDSLGAASFAGAAFSGSGALAFAPSDEVACLGSDAEGALEAESVGGSEASFAGAGVQALLIFGQGDILEGRETEEETDQSLPRRPRGRTGRLRPSRCPPPRREAQ